MAIKTAAEMFGDGGGYGAAVPVSTTNPSGTGAGNRGVQFGEQLTAAIANRPHYALALNDEDLNVRLAEFEVGGLEAAYNLGTAGPAGGGRQITKDAGAVETVSALAAQYDDDVANAHFRADSRADAVDGGGGFEHVGASALYGVMDRRTYDFANNTILSGNVACTLNSGGAAVDGATIGAGVFLTGTDTDLILGYDMVEVLSGSFAGLYVITALPTTTRATLRRLDGTVPAFTANTVTTIRVFRPTFGSFSELGHNGALALDGAAFSGMPGQDSAAIFVPGSTYGRYGTTNNDGARYALKVLHRTAGGSLTTAAHIDGTGQFRSYANVLNLTEADRLAGVDFGNAGFFCRQDENDGNAEVGFLSRQTGGSVQQLAFVASGDCRTPANPAGTTAFNFAVSGSMNVEISDINMADWFIAAGISFIEIVTPTANAGVYLVAARDANTGEMELRAINGAALTLPAAGAGTMRALRTTVIGHRRIDVGFSAWAAAECDTAAVIEAPAHLAGAALTVVASMQNDQALIRGVGIEDGGNYESFRVEGSGAVRSGAKVYANNGFEIATSSGEYIYTTARSKTVNVPIHLAQPATPAGVADWRVTSALAGGWTSFTILGLLFVPLPLPFGAVLTQVRALVAPGANRTPTNRMMLGVTELTVNWTTPGGPVPTAHGTSVEDAGGTSYQYLTRNGLSVLKTASNTILASISAGSSGSPPGDGFYGLEITFTDPGPRND